MNGTLYFSGYDSVNGFALWKSDGTRGTTVVVKSFDTGGAYEPPQGLFNAAGTLYFCAYEAASGRELWKSDGTEAGTTMVTEINPGTADGVSEILAYLDNKVFFSGNDPVSGWGLWKTDGTAANTTMVKNVNATPYVINGVGSSNPRYFVVVDGTLFFSADDDDGIVNGRELWKSDGTPGGTVMVKDINPVGGSNHPLFYRG